jgi:hypothetical protein
VSIHNVCQAGEKLLDHLCMLTDNSIDDSENNKLLSKWFYAEKIYFIVTQAKALVGITNNKKVAFEVEPEWGLTIEQFNVIKQEVEK